MSINSFRVLHHTVFGKICPGGDPPHCRLQALTEPDEVADQQMYLFVVSPKQTSLSAALYFYSKILCSNPKTMDYRFAYFGL